MLGGDGLRKMTRSAGGSWSRGRWNLFFSFFATFAENVAQIHPSKPYAPSQLEAIEVRLQGKRPVGSVPKNRGRFKEKVCHSEA